MVHNGIEYADMQLIAEAYHLLRDGLGASPKELAAIFAEWNSGDLESFLIEITAEVLGHTDAATGIAEATFARALSAHPEQREAAQEALPGPSSPISLADRDTFVDDVRKALYASKVVAYAQGYDQMAAASAEYGWDIDLGAMATIWRGGCIIRARFLDRIRAAYETNPTLPSLLVDPYFRDAVAQG